MSSDSRNQQHLEICKQNAVFHHFPLSVLRNNPGTWTLLKYRYGQLIVRDSNDSDWIYVIKSGEAKVLKYLEPGRVDVKARRKKIKADLEDSSPYHRTQRLLDFMAERTNIRSRYKQNCYQPEKRIGVMSAPALKIPLRTPEKKNGGRKKMKLPSITVTRFDDDSPNCDWDQRPGRPPHRFLAMPSANTCAREFYPHQNRVESRPGKATIAGEVLRPDGRLTGRKAKSKLAKEMSSSFPLFVQVETLYPGQVFGLRGCLEPDKRGPAVSLVSADCDVIQISKRFFAKHCDEAMLSLIQIKAKPYPSREDVIDRLDANLQWDKYKQAMIRDFLRRKKNLK